MPLCSDTLLSQTIARNHRAIVFWQNDDDSFPEQLAFAFSAKKLKQYRSFLGLEHPALLIDFSESFHADALLALAGTVRGGGFIILKVPEAPYPAMQRLMSFCTGEWSGVTSDRDFVLRLLSDFDSQTIPESNSFKPTKEQNYLLQQMDYTLPGRHAYLINAPRGRGKSSLLGHWAALYSSDHQPIYICSPSKRQAAALFTQAGDAPLNFVAPDKLDTLTDLTDSDWLIIDEAASLPAHILDKTKYLNCSLLLATTTEGYESSGRSYSLRFQKSLPDFFDSVTEFSLTNPIRWAAGDSLELALNRCFFVSAPARKITPSTDVADTPQYKVIQAKELEEDLLSQAFELLMEAHYQTSPNDLKLLLDDAHQYLLLQLLGSQVTGVLWFDIEQQTPTPLVKGIYQGKRRPPGNIITQTLIYFHRLNSVDHFRISRIVRIAVTPDLQRQGLGSELLEEYEAVAGGFGINLIGTSFGMSAELTHFWHKSEFRCARIGQRRDPASGYLSALFLKPLNTEISTYLEPHFYHFICAVKYTPHYKQLSESVRTAIINSLGETESLQQIIEHQFQQVLNDYCEGYIEFTEFRVAAAVALHTGSYRPNSDLLKTCISSPESLQKLAREHGFHGKKELAKELHIICASERQSL